MSSCLTLLIPFTKVVPTWDNILLTIENSTSLSKSLKDSGKRAAVFFQELLGKNFFTEKNYDHPFQMKWSNSSPWQIAELVEWMNVLVSLKEYDSNYHFFIKKFISKNKCRKEAIPFLEIVTSLIRVGFEVKFIAEQPNLKTPDIEVRDPETGKCFFIEVSQVNDKDITESDTNNFRVISNACLKFAFELPLSVQMLKRPTRDELSLLTATIESLASKARSNQSMEVYRDDLIEIAVVHPSKSAELDAWRKVNNRTPGVHGLSANFNETARITGKGKIHLKAKQIPFDQTGILYLSVSFLYMFSMDKASTFIELKETLLNYPNVKGVVLYCILGQPYENEQIEIPRYEDLWSIKTINGKTFFYLYAVNDNYQGNINPVIMSKFKRSLVATHSYL